MRKKVPSILNDKRYTKRYTIMKLSQYWNKNNNKIFHGEKRIKCKGQEIKW